MPENSLDPTKSALPAKPFLTTGEAGKILGLSASTVIRRFDKGEFTGKRHPVTGRRLIAKDSLAEFMAAHNLAADQFSAPPRRILVASGDAADGDAVKAAFRRKAPNVAVRHVREGCEVCGRVLEWRPDLAIIHADLPDMAGLDVVRCLRRLPGCEELRIALSSAPDGRPSRKEVKALRLCEWFAKPWNPEVLRDRISKLLGIGGAEKRAPEDFQERRRWPRIATDWPATVKVYLKDGTKAYDSGTAKVRNASQGGVLLSGIQFEQGVLPASPFTLGLNVTGGEGEGIAASCRPVRIDVESELALGVEFMQMRSNQLARIAQSLAR